MTANRESESGTDEEICAFYEIYSYTIYSCRERIYIVQIDARLSDILNESDPCSLQNLVTIIGGPMYRAFSATWASKTRTTSDIYL